MDIRELADIFIGFPYQGRVPGGWRHGDLLERRIRLAPRTDMLARDGSLLPVFFRDLPGRFSACPATGREREEIPLPDRLELHHGCLVGPASRSPFGSLRFWEMLVSFKGVSLLSCRPPDFMFPCTVPDPVRGWAWTHLFKGEEARCAPGDHLFNRHRDNRL